MKPTRHIVKPCKKLWKASGRVWYQKNQDYDSKDVDIRTNEGSKYYIVKEGSPTMAAPTKRKATVSLKSLGATDVTPNVREMEWAHSPTSYKWTTSRIIMEGKSDNIKEGAKASLVTHKPAAWKQPEIRKWKKL